MDIPHMAAKPVQISMDEDLLARIDADPEAKQHGRSRFIRDAVETYLRLREARETDRAIRAAYAGSADELLAEVNDLIGAQTWPDE
jgi:metal-responsive CopG/Arc/MetJ family transcriptional regulator